MKKSLIFLILTLALIMCSCDMNIDEETQSETLRDTVEEVANDEELTGGLELREELIPFTLELTETVYTTSSEKILFRLRSKEPGACISRSDKWILYRIQGGKMTVIGEQAIEIAIEYPTGAADEYLEREESISIHALCSGKKTLDEGEYCLVFPVQAPDENGYYHTYAAASMKFTVVDE